MHWKCISGDRDIENNKDDMKSEALQNVEQKQEKRRIQLENLKDY